MLGISQLVQHRIWVAFNEALYEENQIASNPTICYILFSNDVKLFTLVLVVATSTLSLPSLSLRIKYNYLNREQLNR